MVSRFSPGVFQVHYDSLLGLENVLHAHSQGRIQIGSVIVFLPIAVEACNASKGRSGPPLSDAQPLLHLDGGHLLAEILPHFVASQ